MSLASGCAEQEATLVGLYLAKSASLQVLGDNVGLSVVGSTLSACEADSRSQAQAGLQEVGRLLSHGQCMQLQYVLRDALLLVRRLCPRHGILSTIHMI